jgi:hypothetical protein
MSDTRQIVHAQDVRVGDRITAPTGESLTVTRIDPNFMDRSDLIAFVEDTPERWSKLPLAIDAEVEVTRDAKP